MTQLLATVPFFIQAARPAPPGQAPLMLIYCYDWEDGMRDSSPAVKPARWLASRR